VITQEGKALMKIRLVIAVAMTVALVGAGCTSEGDDPGSDPGAVLAAYESARNSGDVDAVMALYAEDAVVENHPLGETVAASGTQEIRALEMQVPAVQGSTGGIEFTDTVVSGDSVMANYTFFNEDGECFGGKDTEVSVVGEKITLYVWGPDDPSQCG
jgi:ketosteroid isomerase-like protein